MEIKYIYREENNDDYTQQINQMKRENTLNLIVTALVVLCFTFLFFALLPIFLIIIGYAIAFFIALYIYKAYLESHVLNFIQKYNLRRRK